MFTKIKKVFFVAPVLLLALGFGCGKSRPATVPRESNSSQPSNSADAANEPPPDILSATNLAQWRALIKDLKPTQGMRDRWDTSRFRPGSPPVLIRYNNQSIVYKADAIDVSTFPGTMDFMEAQIYSPKMTLDETRALGLRLCSMFGFDTNKFSGWCDGAVTNELTAPANPLDTVFGNGGRSHFFYVHATFNDEKPWYILFTVQDENAVAKLRQH